MPRLGYSLLKDFLKDLKHVQVELPVRMPLLTKLRCLI